MSLFSHPHVLSVIGICLNSEAIPYIVMPFMANGSLLSYLKMERSNIVVAHKENDDAVVCLFSFWYNYSRSCLMGITQAKNTFSCNSYKTIDRALRARTPRANDVWPTAHEHYASRPAEWVWSVNHRHAEGKMHDL